MSKQQEQRSRSIVKLKAEKLDKSKSLRLATADVQNLGNVVRLVDYMLVEGSLDLLVSTIEGLKKSMAVNSIVVTQVSFSSTGMDFNAGEEEIRQVGACWLAEGLGGGAWGGMLQ